MDKQTYTKIPIKTLDNAFEYILTNQREYFDMAKTSMVTALYPEASYIMHTHDFFNIVFFESATGTHSIDFCSYELGDNSLFFLSHGQMHCFKNVIINEGYSVVFSEDMMYHLSEPIRKIIKERLFIPIIPNQEEKTVSPLTSQQAKVVKQGLDKLYRTFVARKNMQGFGDYIAAELTMFLLDICDSGITVSKNIINNSSSDYLTYATFVDFVETNYSNVHSVKECSNQLSISLSTLNRHVRNVSRLDPSIILNNRITLEAKRLLRYKLDLRIKEIAARLGFEDPSNFVKFFKRQVGVTPIKFREDKCIK